MTDNIVLEARNLTKTFNDGELRVDVLKDLQLQVSAGEMLGIIGVSGVGKSTLLQLLGGLDKVSSGEVIVMEKNLSALNEKQKGILRNKYMGFVYQFHHLLPEFNALENIMMPLLIGGFATKCATEKAEHIIDQVGLSNRRLHRVGELSGGERQRIAIARALVTEPRCVLADEPTGNLDEDTANTIFELMQQLNQKYQTSFVVVTHNRDLAKRLHRVLVLNNGKLQIEE